MLIYIILRHRAIVIYKWNSWKHHAFDQKDGVGQILFYSRDRGLRLLICRLNEGMGK